MDCRQAQEWLAARLDTDGALLLDADDAHSKALSAHLAQCSDCRALAAQLRRLDASLAAAHAANDELFDTAVVNRGELLNGRSRTPGSRSRIVAQRWLWSAAGLAAAACITLAWLNPWARQEMVPGAARTHTAEAPPVNVGVGDHARTGATGAPALVRLTGESREKQIAIEQDTSVPRVRLVQVYPLAPRKMPAQDDTEPQT